ncbi:heme exporter protein CcmD [Brucella pseudogrignonensis]|jgi:heme exporter protein D|uniref:Heme exporter protein D n=1 Tax=Brucella pseudogrignonensis TaxID=419475 RepID=A0A256GLK8_9HYPH|nr:MULTISPECIES: heme exporter protein CcmD [Brucella]EMG55375.1 heme exporter protein CcmD [Ochrobactrum sp. CDB2]MCM0750783.1 heme exporter protein CcmD [Brucella pseudogrignonensis]NKX15538.1 heme exporter protein CcmD [Brucella pseudogrignonensis]NNV21312.1 heme exporter protein CcmD [Brucella pseudogrignonensis]OYR27949.1 heme exporter protein CcmD [Brucella pseudogrignonensis]
MGNHLGFVLASYGITVVALAVTIGWILIDQRIQKNELKRLEAQGVRRRSAKASGSAK